MVAALLVNLLDNAVKFTSPGGLCSPAVSIFRQRATINVKCGRQDVAVARRQLTQHERHTVPFAPAKTPAKTGLRPAPRLRQIISNQLLESPRGVGVNTS